MVLVDGSIHTISIAWCGMVRAWHTCIQIEHSREVEFTLQQGVVHEMVYSILHDWQDWHDWRNFFLQDIVSLVRMSAQCRIARIEESRILALNRPDNPHDSRDIFTTLR